MLCKEPLELGDRNQRRPPRHLDGLEEWQHATVERRATDAEGLGRLCPRIGEPLDAGRLTGDRPSNAERRRRRMSLRFRGAAALTAIRHVHNIHK